MPASSPVPPRSLSAPPPPLNKQLSNKSFQLSFSLGFDGDPSYRWRWRVYGANGTYDLLPNKGWVKHDM